ncbi:MAG: hypothetical protein M3X11_11045 [Acidobacteriota bacterium]|nr:hypothetical protein [Acidobacteriota bacterium]
MFKISRRRSPFILSLLMAAVTMFGTFAVFASHSWGGYHWARQTNQFTLKLGNNLTSADWASRLSQTSSDWNSGNSAVLTAIVAGQSNRNCRMVAGTTQVCNANYGNNGWLGLASINITGGTHITQGSAKMNDTYFNTSTYNNPNERLHVMCQEIAHTFGLDHQSEDGSSQNSCMDYFSNTGANAGSTLSTKPNAHDFEELNIIYAHLDSTTTVAAKTAGAASSSDDSDDPNNWGRLTSQSANGRSSTYERVHHDGSKTATHVLWTEEAAARCPGCDHRYDH